MKKSNLSSSSKTSSETNLETNSEPGSRTDWARLDALTDEDIDTSDSPPLSEALLAGAKWLMPGESLPRPAKSATVKVELNLDPQILAWFQSQGQDYERRMLAALRLYAEAHQSAA